MRPVVLLIFFPYFPLHNSLPMEGLLTVGTRNSAGGQATKSLMGHITEVGPDLKTTPVAHQPGSADNIQMGEHHELLATMRQEPPASPASSRGNDLFPSFKTEQSILNSPQTSASKYTHTQASTDAMAKNLVQTPLTQSAKQIYREILGNLNKPQEVTKGWLGNTADSVKSRWPFGPKTVLQIDPEDEKALTSYLWRMHGSKLGKEDTEALNKLYKELSASDRESTTMVRSDSDKFLSEWKRDTYFGRKSVVLDFFKEILPEKELERRRKVLQLQQDQMKIVAGWENNIQSISQKTGLGIEEVKAFGNHIGGNDFFTAFKGHDFQKTWNAIKYTAKKNPKLVEAWKDVLGGEEWQARIQLLKTLKSMEEPNKVSAETISAWRAQGLDVKRMLMIVNYESHFGKSGPGLTFTNLREVESAMETFLSPNAYKVPWLESLEHDQLLKTPELKDFSPKYLEFQSKLEDPHVMVTFDQVHRPPKSFHPDANHFEKPMSAQQFEYTVNLKHKHGILKSIFARLLKSMKHPIKPKN